MSDRSLNTMAATVLAAMLAAGLAGCGKQTSAVAPADQTGGAPATSAGGYGPASPGGSAGAYGASDPRSAPVPQVNGKPMWAANRKYTAEQNAQYQFNKNGRDFAAASESDYVAKVHAFVDHPPGDVETLDRRNGDKLLYDPKANVFAVVSRDGAPRTMFKPRGGASYWDEQKTRVNEPRPAAGSADQTQG